LVIEANKQGLLNAAKDVNVGGLAISAAKMAVVGNKGVEIVAPLNDAKDIFSETLSRAIVEVDYANEEAFENLVSSVGQYCIKIGKVQGDEIIINGVTKSLKEAKNIYFNRFQEVIEQDL
jgi:phosphoribosylformylglycinamidine synthase